jgi:hypothetical protein
LEQEIINVIAVSLTYIYFKILAIQHVQQDIMQITPYHHVIHVIIDAAHVLEEVIHSAILVCNHIFITIILAYLIVHKHFIKIILDKNVIHVIMDVWGVKTEI